MRPHLLRLMIFLVLLAILTIGCSAQDVPTRTASAGTQASRSAPDDQRTMTAGTLAYQDSQATFVLNAEATAAAAAIGTGTAGPALADAHAPAGWNLILYEPFATNNNRWPEGHDDSNPVVHEERDVIGGQYLVKAKARQAFSSYLYPKMPNVLDFYVTVDGRLLSGEPASEYGLAVNLDQNTGDFYAFLIDGEGLWAISLRKGGSWFPIISGRSSQIASGGNHLGVLCIRNAFTFYVNNQQIAQARDDQLSAPGKLGIFVEGNGGGESAIAFDNFTVLTP